MMQQNTPNEVFAVNLAALAREIAMDLFPVEQVLKIHQVSDADWLRIQASPQWTRMLASMIAEWESAMNTRERLKAKAQTGLEMNLEQLILDVGDLDIPLAQRVEAAKFLARIGEVDGQIGGGGPGFSITLNIGDKRLEAEVQPSQSSAPKVIEGTLA